MRFRGFRGTWCSLVHFAEAAALLKLGNEPVDVLEAVDVTVDVEIEPVAGVLVDPAE
jgi:hypothetical protein